VHYSDRGAQYTGQYPEEYPHQYPDGTRTGVGIEKNRFLFDSA
jgi:hypothetical protein